MPTKTAPDPLPPPEPGNEVSWEPVEAERLQEETPERDCAVRFAALQ